MIQLVKKAKQGDADAFLELMENCSLDMYKVARGILGNDNDVADAIQDTILKCFEKIHTLKKTEYFKTWMIRILINECNQILGHYKRVAMPGELPDTPRQDASLAEFEFKEMLELVDEKYRIILVLHYVEGFKIAEIAELLDMKENTVKTRLARAREQIRAAYTDNQPDTKRADQPGTKQVAGQAEMQSDHSAEFYSELGGIPDEKTNYFTGIGRYTAG